MTKPQQTALQASLQYRPPKIVEGATIKFFPTPGDTRNFTTATVQKVETQTLVVWTVEGRKMNMVRFKDDPRVKEARIAQYGVWDFTEAYLREQQILDALNSNVGVSVQRLNVMEQSIGDIKCTLEQRHKLDGSRFSELEKTCLQKIGELESDIAALRLEMRAKQSTPKPKKESNPKDTEAAKP